MSIIFDKTKYLCGDSLNKSLNTVFNLKFHEQLKSQKKSKPRLFYVQGNECGTFAKYTEKN